MKDKWKNLESSKREATHYIQGASVRLTADDLLETMEARKQWMAHAKCWKERDQPRILYSPNYLSKTNEKLKRSQITKY